MTMSILILLLLTLFAMSASGKERDINTKYNGLRVKYGITNGFFYLLPRTIAEAGENVWQMVDRPQASLLPSLRLLCSRYNVNFCLYFDQNGFVSGVQVAVPVEAVNKVPGDPSTKFVPWNNVSIGGTTKDYWTSSLFFVSEETLKTGNAPTSTAFGTLQDDKMWALDPSSPGGLMTIPLGEEELIKDTQFKKQSCIPNMGTNYYYNVTRQLPCERMLPWSVLVKDGVVIGAAFQTIGYADKTGNMNWFEDISVQAIKVGMPDSPDCFIRRIKEYGLISIHVYFILKPWEIQCAQSD